MSRSRVWRLLLATAALFAAGAVVSRAIDSNGNGIEDRLELPGTQPGVDPLQEFNIDVLLAAADGCAGCHENGGISRPFTAWNGTMMANAGRDPVFWAQLDIAEFDEGAVSDGRLRGGRDLCLRCHAPKGWLEARSHDPDANLGAPTPIPAHPDFLRGMRLQEDDLFGVQCEVCHRMLDPQFSVPIASVDAVDRLMLDGGTGTGGLLGGGPGIPQSYGGGMYVVDRKDVRRGPYNPTQIGYTAAGWEFIDTPADWANAHTHEHPVRSSAFHRRSDLCGTCHDVSNPAWPPSPGQPLAPDLGNAQAHFPIERTSTEWKYSAFPALGEAGTCQGCHMNGPLNGVSTGPVSEQADIEHAGDLDVHLNDVHVHDFTGGNAVIPLAIDAMIQRVFTTNTANPGADPYPTAGCSTGTAQQQRDCFLSTYYAKVIRALYPLGALARAEGLPDPTPKRYNSAALQAAASRARATLARAAELSKDLTSDLSTLKVMVWNKSGHKLPTGYPEGRRMWLKTEFEDINVTTGSSRTIAVSGEYDNSTEDSGFLFHDVDLDGAKTPAIPNDVVKYTDGTGTGNPPMDGATEIPEARRTQVWEYRARHDAAPADPTLQGREFHFILNNQRQRDNRIPPQGWSAANYAANGAAPVRKYTSGAFQDTQYLDSGCGEPTCNFDRVPYPVPGDSTGESDSAKLTLYYQSVSREYVKALKADNPRALVYSHTGDATGYTRGDVLEHAWRTMDLLGAGRRFPPVEMKTLRVAIQDSDGDGLPNHWESAFGLNPNGATAAQKNTDRHGDLDGDGRSNYQEYQKNSNPTVADGPARTPLDLALVLDFSGSMTGLAPHGDRPKIDVLKDAVDLFLSTWEPYATANDRLAIVYFASNVTVEGGTIVDFSTLAGDTIAEKLEGLVTAVRAGSAGGSTALGGGLQRALNLVRTGGTGHRKHVIAFTNGMQNFSPMVRTGAGGHYVIRNDDPAAFDDVYGTSGQTDAGGPAFGTSLSSLGVTVHTIGIGVAETSDDRWVTLLQGIAQDTQDLSGNQGLYQFVSRASELEGAFLTDLVETLRNFSPQLLGKREATLAAGQDAVSMEFPMEAAAERATFALSWAGDTAPGRLQLSVSSPDGGSAADLGRVSEGPNYVLFHCYFPLARLDGRPVEHAGKWTVQVSRQPLADRDPKRQRVTWKDAVDFRAYVVAEIPASDHAVRFMKRRYAAGETVVLQAAVRQNSGFVRQLQTVTAEVTRPSAAFGTFLSKTEVSQRTLDQLADVGGDTLPDRAAAKSYALLSAPGTARMVPLRRETVILYDDGAPAHGDSVARDGVFSASLGKVETPGLLTAQVSLEGLQPAGGPVSRKHTATAFVTNAAFSAESVLVGGETVRRLASGAQQVRILVTPVDVLGNFLGPGYADRIRIDVAGVTGGPIQDVLDGRYAREYSLAPGELSRRVIVSVDDATVFDGSVRTLVKTPWVFPLWLLILLLLVILVLVVLLILRSRAPAPGP